MTSEMLIIGGVVLVILLVAVITFISKYTTVSPDKALIISGSYLGSKNVVSADGDGDTRKVKILSGGGAFVLPVFQQAQTLSLLSHKIDVSTPEVYTEQGVPIMSDATAIIKVGGVLEDILSAAEQFLGKPEEVLRQEAQEVLEGHLRSILGSMTVEEIYKNRDKFAQEVQSVAAKDLKKMGLTIVSFTIKDVRDKNGYLDSLGKPRIAEVKRNATIAEAEALREASVKKAQNDEQARKAEIAKDTNIAEAEKDMELKKAAFQKEQDTARAEADAAYGIQKAISDKSVIEATMKAQQIQKERDIELAEKETIRREKELEATVKKEADAELYRRTQEAEASRVEQETRARANAESMRLQAEAEAAAKKAKAAADAEAERAKGRAEADVEKARGIATAEAEKAKTEIVKSQGEMEAAAERARIDNLSAEGKATAEAIQAKGMAEATIFEAKAKAEVDRELGLAEAQLILGKLRYVELITAALPEIAAKIAEPMGNIDKLTIIDTNGNGEGGGGMGKLTNQVATLMKFMPELVENMTGINLGDVLANATNGRIGVKGEYDALSFDKLLELAKGVDPEVLAKLMESFPQPDVSETETK